MFLLLYFILILCFIQSESYCVVVLATLILFQLGALINHILKKININLIFVDIVGRNRQKKIKMGIILA